MLPLTTQDFLVFLQLSKEKSRGEWEGGRERESETGAEEEEMRKSKDISLLNYNSELSPVKIKVFTGNSVKPN